VFDLCDLDWRDIFQERNLT